MTTTIDKEPVYRALNTSTASLIQTLESFPPELFNTRPSSGGWCAGEVAEHLLALEKNINHILATPAKPAERPADEKVNLVEQVFADFTKKYNAPSFIKPTGEAVDQQHIITELTRQKEQLSINIGKSDLNELCTDFPHNRLGTFTKLEWIYFTIYHTRRHLRQIENLLGDVPRV